MGVVSETTVAEAAAARPRRLHNPFPRPSPGLEFVRGHLHRDPAAPLPPRTLAVGKSFLVSWDSRSLAVHHRRQPQRALWTTPSTGAFVAAALGESAIHESHGSFSVNDQTELLLDHQTIEDIAEGVQSGGRLEERACSDWKSVCFGSGAGDLAAKVEFVRDADGTLLDGDAAAPVVVVVTGCLYSSGELAKGEIWRNRNGNRREDHNSPFYETGNNEPAAPAHGVGVRYRLTFSERRDNQLGFHVELSTPLRKHVPSKSPTHSSRRSSEKSSSRRSLSRRWKRVSPREWSEWSELRRVKPVDSTSPEQDEVMMPRLNRVMLSYGSHPGEHFFGFGEQFSCLDMKGRRVPILVQEQGLGRGDQPITAAANLVAYRAGGDWHTTYAPSPHYLTSDMNSLFLEGYEHAVFDLTQGDCVQVQVHAGEMKGRILYGQTPSELIKEYTAAVGRMRALPAWITKGAIVGMQGGRDAVKEVWRKVKEYEVPLSAFWLQDWVGQRKTSVGMQLWWNWEVDRTHYPDWEELVSDLRSHGVRTMAYLNPFIVAKPRSAELATLPQGETKELFAKAVEEGYAVADSGGRPYMLPITSFDAALLDLSNPETKAWLKGLMREMVRSGVRGWMADFGESLPFDACLHSGEDPAIAHNRYPELWAELNREFVEEWEEEQRSTKQLASRHPRPTQEDLEEDMEQDLEENNEEDLDQDLEEENNEELVFFMRAGYRGSPRWATLFWEGDQMVSWQRHDGIKSTVTGLLSSGLSGFAFNHSDIGGYCTVDLPLLRYRRSEELLLRWMELNAFSVVFRSHEGNIPGANAQIYSNDTTLRHFARCAKIYRAWEFYRRQLVKEAAAVGMPVVRHLFLHYPEDPFVHTLVYQQFLVGSEILVVPVLDPGRSHVQAYFPSAGDGVVWEHVWTGDCYEPPTTTTTTDPKQQQQQQQGLHAEVQASLGFPAVFVKRGSWVGNRFLRNLVKEKVKQ